MCAAACTVNPAGARSSAGSVPAGLKEGRSPEQWTAGNREDSQSGKPRVRPRDALLHAEECTPTKRIGGLSGDGNILNTYLLNHFCILTTPRENEEKVEGG